MPHLDTYHKLKRQDLLNRCRYYKGEDSFQGPKHAFCWGFERQWVKTILGQEYVVVKGWIQKYIEGGFAKFRPLDGTPLGVKSVMFNQYDLWSGGNVEGFPIWYLHYYLNDNTDLDEETLRIRQGCYKRPINDHEVWKLYDWAHLQDSIAQCRCYREGEECPDEHNSFWWDTEKDWVYMNSHHGKRLLDKCLEDYIYHNLGNYRPTDDVPSTLKAYAWYKMYYPQETWNNPYDENHPIFQNGPDREPYPFRDKASPLCLAFKISYERDYLKLKESPTEIDLCKSSEDIPTFARKYVHFFEDGDATDEYLFTESNTFPKECESFGFDMDCLHSYEEAYKAATANSQMSNEGFVSSLTDKHLIGTALFSKWRYYNHWAYPGETIWNSREWFILMFQRLLELYNKPNEK